MEEIYELDNYQLHVIKTKKFKNISISIKLQNKLEKDTCTLRTLLSLMFIAGTKEYPTIQDLSKYLEDLYGMRIGTSVTTKGLSHIINISLNSVNQHYLPVNDDLNTKQVKLLNDILNNLYSRDNKFDDEIFERRKKDLKEKLIASKDDKFTYGITKLLEFMGEETALGIPASGYLEDVDNITNEQLYEYYQKCLKNDAIEIFVVGDVDDSLVDNFKNYFKVTTNKDKYPSVYLFESNKKEVKQEIERQDVSQSKLNIGYTIRTNFLTKNHYAFSLFNAIFGGNSQSRLFKVVREQNSLCYYISSSYDAFNSVMLVNAGIDNDKYDQAVCLVNQQLEDMQAGNISDEEIKLAKIMLTNMYIRTKDDPSSIIAMKYNHSLINQPDKDDYVEKINEITKEEIINVSKEVKLDTIFYLTGRNG